MKSTRTSAVIAIAVTITAMLEPVSWRSRTAATPISMKITMATTLPIWAMAVRSNTFASRSTPAAEMTSPLGPPSARPPKKGGNICSFASSAVMLPAAKRLALTDDDVASSAAIDIIVKPASPSAGSAACASAVSPYCWTSSVVRAPKVPSEMST